MRLLQLPILSRSQLPVSVAPAVRSPLSRPGSGSPLPPPHHAVGRQGLGWPGRGTALAYADARRPGHAKVLRGRPISAPFAPGETRHILTERATQGGSPSNSGRGQSQQDSLKVLHKKKNELFIYETGVFLNQTINL